MSSYGNADDIGHRHRSESSCALWGTALRDSGPYSQELAFHPHPSAQEVNVIDAQPKALSLSNAHARAKDD
jgi:hypothetical protein